MAAPKKSESEDKIFRALAGDIINDIFKLARTSSQEPNLVLNALAIVAATFVALYTSSGESNEDTLDEFISNIRAYMPLAVKNMRNIDKRLQAH